MKLLILGMISILSAGAGRPDVHGRVTGTDGRPIPGATAFVYTAAVKIGTSPYCPSCYPDCGKSAQTNSDGRFTIRALDPELKFRLLFVADGYKPGMVASIDPAAAETVQVKLDGMPEHLDPDRVLKGRVIGPDGAPVLGAIVTPYGCKTADNQWWGTMPGVDPLSITNARGEFIITAGKPAIAYDIRVEARGLATKSFPQLPLGEKPQELQLGEGAIVIGRLLQDGKPVAGVNVGLVQENRGPDAFTGARTVGTDAAGKFTFLNVAPAGDWCVYGVMSSVAPRGATRTELVSVLGERSTSDVGDLTICPSCRLAGRVVLSDGKPVPPNTRLMVDRKCGWDLQKVILDENGRFSISGLPAESVTVAVQVKGYHLSLANRSLDSLNLTFLRGRIEHDTSDLTILMEPGKLKIDPSERQRLRDTRPDQKTLDESPIEGVGG